MISEFHWTQNAGGCQVDIRYPTSLTASDIADIEGFLATLVRQLIKRNAIVKPAGDKK